jgi:hypothetical protein
MARSITRAWDPNVTAIRNREWHHLMINKGAEANRRGATDGTKGPGFEVNGCPNGCPLLKLGWPKLSSGFSRNRCKQSTA